MSTYPNTLSLHYPQASKLRVRPSAARSARWQGEYVSTQFIARLSSCHQTIALGSESKPGWLSSVNRLKAVIQRGVRALSDRWEEWNLKCVCVCLCADVSCYSCRLLIDPDNLREWCTSQGLAPGAGFICAGLHDGTHTQKHTHTHFYTVNVSLQMSQIHIVLVCVSTRVFAYEIYAHISWHTSPPSSLGVTYPHLWCLSKHCCAFVRKAFHTCQTYKHTLLLDRSTSGRSDKECDSSVHVTWQTKRDKKRENTHTHRGRGGGKAAWPNMCLAPMENHWMLHRTKARGRGAGKAGIPRDRVVYIGLSHC